MTKKGPKRTVGMLALGRVGRTPEQIARETGLAPVLVRQLLTGHKTPTAAQRKTLQTVYAAIRASSWDEIAPVFTPEAPNVQAVVGGLVGEYLETARNMLDQIKHDPVATPEYKTKLMRGCLTAISGAAKLSGESGEISEAKILKSPAWARIRAAMFDALIAWPEATRAVSDALTELHGK